jgi:hypothetical protein
MVVLASITIKCRQRGEVHKVDGCQLIGGLFRRHKCPCKDGETLIVGVVQTLAHGGGSKRTLGSLLGEDLIRQHHLLPVTLNHLSLLLDLEIFLPRHLSVCSASLSTRLINRRSLVKICWSACRCRHVDLQGCSRLRSPHGHVISSYQPQAITDMTQAQFNSLAKHR